MRRKWFIVGTVFIILGFYIIFSQTIIFNRIFSVIEQSLNPTIQLTYEAERLFYLSLNIIAISFLIMGGVIAASSKVKFRNALEQTFLTDEVCSTYPSMPKPVTILFFSSLLGIFFTTLYSLRGLLDLEYLYQEDGFFESLTAINYFAASLLIALSVRSMRKMENLKEVKNYKFIIITFILILSILFIIGMEEISWGQRIFGWETPTYLTELNYSDETNIHNIFTPYFYSLYRFFGLFFLISLIAGWLFVRRWHTFFYNIIFPHPNLIVLPFFISIAGLTKLHELLEELFSLFCIFYAIRVFLCFRSEEQIADSISV